jgi:cysteine-rich repeat protein
MTMPRRWLASGAILGAAGAAVALAGCRGLLEAWEDIGLCGDGVVQERAEEACDDGNTTSGDGCSSSCKKEVCGNEILDANEECDDGLLNDNGSACIRQCRKARCGDGYLKVRGTGAQEVCDDGNLDNGDGCNPQCRLRGRVSVVVGSPPGRGVADGVGGAARVSGVRSLVSDGRRLYFWDSGACAVRGLDPRSGVVATVAGVVGECAGPTLRRDGPGDKATFIGSGTGIRRDDGTLLALAGKTLYVLDAAKSLLRTVDLAGSDHQVRTCALLVKPQSVNAMVADPADTGTLYLAGAGTVHALALPCQCNASDPASGSCTLTTVGTAGAFKGTIRALAPAAEGGKRLLYVAEPTRISSIDLDSGTVTAVAGAATAGHLDAPKGSDARFMVIRSLAWAKGDGLYVVQHDVSYDPEDLKNLSAAPGWTTIRRVDPSSGFAVTTVAGITGSTVDPQSTESDGFGAGARLVSAHTALASGGVLYVGEDASIRALDLQTQQLDTVAGVLQRDFTLHDVRAVAARGGRLYAQTRAGQLVGFSASASEAPRRISTCRHPSGLSRLTVEAIVAAEDELYYVDSFLGGVCRVYLEGKDRAGKAAGTAGCSTCSGTVERVYPPAGLSSAAYDQRRTEFLTWNVTGMAFDGKRYLYLLGRNAHYKKILTGLTNNLAGIIRVDTRGGATKILRTATALPANPWGLAWNGGSLYITGAAAHNLVRLDLDDKDGVLQTVGDGLAETLDAADKGGPRFCNPLGITSDGTHLFVAEALCDRSGGAWVGNAVRQLDPAASKGAKGSVTTLLGPGALPYLREGIGRQASLNWPAALTYDDKTAALYAADMWAGAIVKID